VEIDVVLRGAAGVKLACGGELDFWVVMVQEVQQHFLCIYSGADPPCSQAADVRDGLFGKLTSSTVYCCRERWVVQAASHGSARHAGSPTCLLVGHVAAQCLEQGGIRGLTRFRMFLIKLLPPCWNSI
jgi:hypothetical protein